MPTWNVDIEQVQEPAGNAGRMQWLFKARCRETGLTIKGLNPEQLISKAMIAADYADDPVQFWRPDCGGVKSLLAPSLKSFGARPSEAEAAA